MNWFYYIFLFTVSSAFRFHNPIQRINVKSRERNEIIVNSLSERQRDIVNKISGFYGIIGPDLNYSNIKSLYDLFTGDGVIQGVFFDNGNISFVKHVIRTDKILHEERYGRLQLNMLTSAIFMFLNKLGIFPNILGLANTAITTVANRHYALFERDVPYEIGVDFKTRSVNTKQKAVMPAGLIHFSAHSKVSNNFIETIDYDVYKQAVTYYLLNNSFSEIKSAKINCKYLPTIHDFVVTQDYIIMVDAPLRFDINAILRPGLPISLDKYKSTYVHIINKSTGDITTLDSCNSFFLFHYANVIEMIDRFEVYACLYDKLSFSSFDIHGKYRKLIIYKNTGEVDIETREWFECMNLDFPIRYGDKTIMRSIMNGFPDGLVIAKNLELIKHISFMDKFACGEHSILHIDGQPYVIVFLMHKTISNSGYISIINLSTYETIEIPIPMELSIGFHSIFIEKN